MAGRTQHSSAALQAFQTPEIFGQILSHLSAVDFVRTQVAHPQFMAVAMLMPKLRRKFYLEADPVTSETQKAIINPAFEAALEIDDWWVYPRLTNTSTTSRACIYCLKYPAGILEGGDPRKIPEEMLLFAAYFGDTSPVYRT